MKAQKTRSSSSPPSSTQPHTTESTANTQTDVSKTAHATGNSVMPDESVNTSSRSSEHKPNGITNTSLHPLNTETGPPPDQSEDAKENDLYMTSPISSIPEDFTPSPSPPRRSMSPPSPSPSPSPISPSKGQKRKRSTEEAIESDGEAETDVIVPTVSAEEESAAEDDETAELHKEALAALTRIEMEFAKLRDKMYREKVTELEKEILMVERGTHPELTSLMKEIEEKRQSRLDTANVWLKYQEFCYQKQYEGIEYQAKMSFMRQKADLRRNMIKGVSVKKWKMEHERTKLNEIAPAPVSPLLDRTAFIRRRKTRKIEVSELKALHENKGFPAAPPVQGLLKTEITDDLELLRLQQYSSGFANYSFQRSLATRNPTQFRPPPPPPPPPTFVEDTGYYVDGRHTALMQGLE
ncbi:uncharacterized protein VTP21DRAFT_10315 [Calcarisporiella thermophila]|uniref:uncharacterized protein n=1 Tax=Calcarisporiella thermophila TaxID=911321 RepID=UPI0037423170